MTEAALLAAVLDDYDDDAPRLILADWWEENGQGERGEFVRVQCRIAESPYDQPCYCFTYNPGTCQGCRHNERLAALRRRERELLNANFGVWTDGLPESLATRQCPSCEYRPADYETNVIECRQCDCTGLVPDQSRVEFRRGFVHAVTCTVADWLEHGDAILAAQPVEEVTLTNRPIDSADWYRLSGPVPRYGSEEEVLSYRWSRVRHWHLPPVEVRSRSSYVITG